jgi:hypothetical protein
MGMKVWFMSAGGDDGDASEDDGDSESGVGGGPSRGGASEPEEDGLRRRERSTPGRGESYAASRAKLLKATGAAGRRDD